MEIIARLKGGATVVLVVGYHEDGRPGFVALDINTGHEFQHFGRCITGQEVDKCEEKFASWKNALGPVVTVVEFKRGEASIHMIEEMRLRSSMGVSQIDLVSLLLVISTVTGETFELDSLSTARQHDLPERARLVGALYRYVIKQCDALTGMYKSARTMVQIYARG